MSYPKPPQSKSAVRRAGKNIASGSNEPNFVQLLDEWRAAHGYVINTFQAWLKGHINTAGISVEFAQRLKRKNTVIDKLRRCDEHNLPLISDVVAMHDFAGCRMIFNRMSELEDFRKRLHSNAIMRNVDHRLKHSLDKFDYIQSPKFSGYRGIHDVYQHFPRGHNRSDTAKKPWDGLLVEVQYRTRAQHAWATAVEISDLLDGKRTKFAMDVDKRGRLFALASEVIARHHEDLSNSLIDLSDNQLSEELCQLERELKVFKRLSLLKQIDKDKQLKRHNVLNMVVKNEGQIDLEIYTFRNAHDAIEKATDLESDLLSSNAVYVRSDNPNQLRSAYRNYFNDPVDFVELVKTAVPNLPVD